MSESDRSSVSSSRHNRYCGRRRFAAGLLGVLALTGCTVAHSPDRPATTIATPEKEPGFTVGDFEFTGEKPSDLAIKYIERTSPSGDHDSKALARHFQLRASELGEAATPKDYVLAAIAGTINSTRIWEDPELAARFQTAPDKAAQLQQSTASGICIARRDLVLPGTLEFVATAEYNRHIAALQNGALTTEPLRTTIDLDEGEVADTGSGYAATPTITLTSPAGTIVLSPEIEVVADGNVSDRKGDDFVQVITWSEAAA